MPVLTLASSKEQSMCKTKTTEYKVAGKWGVLKDHTSCGALGWGLSSQPTSTHRSDFFFS